MNKRLLMIYLLTGLSSVLILILSMSFFGSEGFRWFSGFTWDTKKAKDSVSINVSSLIIVGVGLSIAGTAMQGVTRNNLASSYSLGTIAAATLSMIIVNYVFNIRSGIITILLTMLFTIIISSSLMIITFSPKVNPSKVIVIGLIFSVLISSITYILREQYNLTSKMISFFAMDKFESTWKSFYFTAPFIGFGSLILILLAKQINIFLIDPEKAMVLGINKNVLRTIVSFTVITITAASVYLVGPISFVGILIPQLSRMVLGNKATTRKVMLLSIPISIIILLSAEMLTRKYFYLGLTINVLIAAISGPIIIYSIIRRPYD